MSYLEQFKRWGLPFKVIANQLEIMPVKTRYYFFSIPLGVAIIYSRTADMSILDSQGYMQMMGILSGFTFNAFLLFYFLLRITAKTDQGKESKTALKEAARQVMIHNYAALFYSLISCFLLLLNLLGYEGIVLAFAAVFFSLLFINTLLLSAYNFYELITMSN